MKLSEQRDEPSEGADCLRRYTNLHEREEMTSAEIVRRSLPIPSGEWCELPQDKGPISQTQLAVLLKEYRDQNGEGVARRHQAFNGYFRAQFKNAFARLLQKPAREPDIRTRIRG